MKTTSLVCSLAIFGSTSLSAQSPLADRFDSDQATKLLVPDHLAPLPGATIARGLDGAGVWNVSLITVGAYSTNAFELADAEGDWHFDYEAAISYDWWLPGGALTLSPFVKIGGSRFDRFSDLSGESFSAGFTMEPKVPFALQFSYDSTWFYDEGFENRVLALHRVGVAIGPKPNEFSPAPSLGKEAPKMRGQWANLLKANYQFADPSISSSANIGLSSTVSYQFTDKLSGSLAAGIGFREYTDYPGRNRTFWRTTVDASLDYQLNKWVGVSAGVSYTNSEDSAFGRDFDGLVGSLIVSVNWESEGTIYVPKTADGKTVYSK